MTQTIVNEDNAASEARFLETLTTDEKDALGEIGNICMGTSATTLSTLLDKRVTITTPSVTIIRGNEYLNEYERPVVATEVSYTQGIDGHTVFLLKKDDALMITTVLLGGDDQVEDLYMSAISEVMNQMVGASSTALADILHEHVNIAPPVTKEISPGSIEEDGSKQTDELLIRISFKLEIEDLLASNIMQLLPFDFGKRLASSLMAPAEPQPQAVKQPQMPAAAPAPVQNIEHKVAAAPVQEMYVASPPPEKKQNEKMELKAVKYQSFNDENSQNYAMMPSDFDKSNIDLIIDVPLQVTVLLGRSKKSIKEILELGRGSIIVLDRLAGEMVDVLVNGKLFARGEVVVIDDNYGVRITELTAPDKAKSS